MSADSSDTASRGGSVGCDLGRGLAAPSNGDDACDDNDSVGDGDEIIMKL